jgi:hypothetical protein
MFDLSKPKKEQTKEGNLKLIIDFENYKRKKCKNEIVISEEKLNTIIKTPNIKLTKLKKGKSLI